MTTRRKKSGAFFAATVAAVLLVFSGSGEVQAKPPKGKITADKDNASGGSSKKKRRKRRSKRKRKTIRYKVKSGDTLVDIAKQYEVSVDQIVRWNKLKNPDQLSIGQKLKIATRVRAGRSSSSSGRRDRKVIYIVRKGDTLVDIAKKNDVSLKQLLKWNRRVRKNPDRLRIGQKITLYKKGPATGSYSVGLANRGRLYNAEKLPRGKGYLRRNPGRAWGTNLTVTHIMEVMAKYGSKWPSAPKAVVGDLSFRKGGKMKPHKSHQSGRDVDLGYIDKDGNQYDRFEKMNSKNFDVAKNWYIIKSFLDTGDIEYIFIDRRLQKLLYNYAKKKGIKQSYLDKVFQYPRRKGTAKGIIRHARGHRNHMHIRFTCPKGDKECK